MGCWDPTRGLYFSTFHGVKSKLPCRSRTRASDRRVLNAIRRGTSCDEVSQFNRFGPMRRPRASRRMTAVGRKREGEQEAERETLCSVDVFRFRERNSLTSGEEALSRETLRRNENDGGQERKQLNARARVVALFRHGGDRDSWISVLNRLARTRDTVDLGPASYAPRLPDRSARAALHEGMSSSPPPPTASLHARD